MSWLAGWLDPRTHALRRDLQQAGFAAAELQAVLDVPAMRAQLNAFQAAGGVIRARAADFSGANGSPECITFHCPPGGPEACPHSTYESLAHELGHALQYPLQWRAAADFESAQAYADAREMGEAHAWLNQYRLMRARLGDGPLPPAWVELEHDGDFGRETVDLYARLAAMERAGRTEADLLRELATCNANMFPCGMGAHNHKTYGQCNRWDWLLARQASLPAFRAFHHLLGRACTPNEQKLLMKFNLFTGLPGSRPGLDAQAPLPADLCALAQQLGQTDRPDDLAALWQLARCQVPNDQTGIVAGNRLCRPEA